MTETTSFAHDELPDFAERIIRAYGLATINWGRVEQLLDLLLRMVDDPAYKTGEKGPVPNISFRLRSERFERLFAKHPSFSAVHHIASPVCVGLRKANKSRIRLTHGALQKFDAISETATVIIIRGHGNLIKSHTGTWTAKEIEDASDLFAFIRRDLQRIAKIVDTPEFRESLYKELSRTQRALVWARHLRYRAQDQCSRICGTQA